MVNKLALGKWEKMYMKTTSDLKSNYALIFISKAVKLRIAPNELIVYDCVYVLFCNFEKK